MDIMNKWGAAPSPAAFDAQIQVEKISADQKTDKSIKWKGCYYNCPAGHYSVPEQDRCYPCNDQFAPHNSIYVEDQSQSQIHTQDNQCHFKCKNGYIMNDDDCICPSTHGTVTATQQADGHTTAILANNWDSDERIVHTIDGTTCKYICPNDSVGHKFIDGRCQQPPITHPPTPAPFVGTCPSIANATNVERGKGDIRVNSFCDYKCNPPHLKNVARDECVCPNKENAGMIRYTPKQDPGGGGWQLYGLNDDSTSQCKYRCKLGYEKIDGKFECVDRPCSDKKRYRERSSMECVPCPGDAAGGLEWGDGRVLANRGDSGSHIHIPSGASEGHMCAYKCKAHLWRRPYETVPAPGHGRRTTADCRFVSRCKPGYWYRRRTHEGAGGRWLEYDRCEICPPAHKCPGGNIANFVGPRKILCPPNTYATGEGNTQCTPCQPCPAGGPNRVGCGGANPGTCPTCSQRGLQDPRLDINGQRHPYHYYDSNCVGHWITNKAAGWGCNDEVDERDPASCLFCANNGQSEKGGALWWKWGPLCL